MKCLYFTSGLISLSALAFSVDVGIKNDGEQNHHDTSLNFFQDIPVIRYQQRREVHEDKVIQLLEGLTVLRNHDFGVELPFVLKEPILMLQKHLPPRDIEEKIESLNRKLLELSELELLCRVTIKEFFAVLSLFPHWRKNYLKLTISEFPTDAPNFAVEPVLNLVSFLVIKSSNITFENLLWFFYVFPTLERLQLDGTTLLAKQLWNYKSQVPQTITAFSCQYCELDLDDFLSFSYTLPNLSDLNLSYNPKIGNNLEKSGSATKT